MQGQEVIEQQLIGYFSEWLHSNNIKFSLMREAHTTLKAAIQYARREQTRFNHSTGHEFDRAEEPMDVSLARPARECFKCHKVGHIAKQCTERLRPGVTHQDRVYKPIHAVQSNYSNVPSVQEPRGE